jgi:hypothetical protein
VKAFSAGVCAAKAKLEAGARQRITALGRRGIPKRQRGVNPFGSEAGRRPPHGRGFAATYLSEFFNGVLGWEIWEYR